MELQPYLFGFAGSLPGKSEPKHLPNGGLAFCLNTMGSNPYKQEKSPVTKTKSKYIHSRELTYPTLGSSENHLQNAIFWGYVSSLEGTQPAHHLRI